MTKAMQVAQLVQAYCRVRFPDDPVGMECSTVQYLSVFRVVDAGSHKYVPAERLSRDIGAPPGAGVYGYEKMDDGSYLLLTCHHGVAVWDGTDAPASIPARI